MKPQSSDDPLTGFDRAYHLTMEAVTPLPVEAVPLEQLPGRVLAEPVYSKIDVPSLDISLKDGFALRSSDVATASSGKPVTLHNIGSAAAGGSFEGRVREGTAVRVLSGAPLPDGADAILAEEYARLDGERIVAFANAGPGRNIMRRGSDIRQGALLLEAGTVLNPPQVGLLAAAGYERLAAVRRPRVAIIATGDEVVAPGLPLRPGAVYASNLVTLQAWCRRYGMDTLVRVVGDEAAAIRAVLLETLPDADALLTSGGTWKGERDLIVHLLDQLRWQKLYHRVRLGPGKGVGFGLWQGKAVFVLPGGPPSNQTAFLQLALPALHKMAGLQVLGLPRRTSVLLENAGGQRDWTQFVEGRLESIEGRLGFRPLKLKSRLQSMAETHGYLQIPEGVESFVAGCIVDIQLADDADFM